MKYSKAEVHCKTHGLPALRFEDSQLTSFLGPRPPPSAVRSSGAQGAAAPLLQPSHRQSDLRARNAGTVFGSAPHAGIPAVERYALLFG